MKISIFITILFLLSVSYTSANRATFSKLDSYYSTLASENQDVTSRRRLTTFGEEEDDSPSIVWNFVGWWKASAADDFNIAVDSDPDFANIFVVINENGVNFEGASGFIDSGNTKVYTWEDVCDCVIDGEDGEDGERRVLSQKRVLDGEDGEDEEEEYTGRDGDFVFQDQLFFQLDSTYYCQIWWDGSDYNKIYMDFTDEEEEENYGWIDFDRWDVVAFYRNAVYGVWIEEGGTDEEVVLNADFNEAYIESEETYYAWYECDGDFDTEEETLTISFDDDYSITRGFDDDTATWTADDADSAIEFASDAIRKPYFIGNYFQFGDVEYGSGYDSSDCEVPEEFEIDSTGLSISGEDIAWADLTFYDSWYTVGGTTGVTLTPWIGIEFQSSSVAGIMVMDAEDGNLLCTAQFSIVESSWSCPSGNMGCEEGTKVGSSSLADNGEYIQERTFDNALIVIRFRSVTDNDYWSTVRAEMTQGASTFDIVDAVFDAAEADGTSDALCGANALFKSADNINWIFVESDDCYLKLKPFRGVIQVATYTYTGTVDEFIADVIPQIFDALYDAIVAVITDFKRSQLVVSDVYFSSRRRLRALDDDEINFEYNIEPEDTSVESDGDEDTDDFAAVQEDLEDAAAAASDAQDDLEIDGVEFTGITETSQFIIDDGTTDLFAPDEEEDEDEESDGNGEEETSGKLIQFSTLLMTLLCLAIGLFGQ